MDGQTKHHCMAPDCTIYGIPGTGNGFHEVVIDGHISRPHWMIHLLGALAARQISVVSGFAYQEKFGLWKAGFNLDFTQSASALERLDFYSFVHESSDREGGKEPLLSFFSVTRTMDDLLELYLEGPDQIGFLSSILARVASLALFPVALNVETVDGRIRDRIVLCRIGVGFHSPSYSSYTQLHSLLQSFMVEEDSVSGDIGIPLQRAS